MLTRLTPIVALAVLSGCSLTKGEQYHNETLASIQASETNVSTKLENLSLQLSNQTDYIESLEKKIGVLDREMIRLKKDVVAEVRKKNAPVVIPAPTPEPPTPTHNIVLGEVEKVTIDTIKQAFDARVDTGAATSSLNAIDIEEFERNGNNWVRFHLSDGDTPPTEDNWIEAPVIRYVKIRQSTNEDVERRAVVELWVELGKIHEKAQFTLADRSQMSHPVLLGREFIRDIAVVDVSKKYIQTPPSKSKK
ncbi:ATP-dependent zinc protease family protein [Vibrio hepatarius]|jgi:hypothetical protein|uniref:ATP-dependent Zn protease n=1 Tax=Vibrio hepatarius TaxID=171383 RepID=A0A0M0HV01_9VIBR|nr:ATP-dependent zinc protease [Vibrio hepatarius]KOO05900.1 ATP-dependent Zn protease [Vibrio hepatarius]NOI12754.1 ATP-dependent zinc protease [Vibrio hepatarius]